MTLFSITLIYSVQLDMATMFKDFKLDGRKFYCQEACLRRVYVSPIQSKSNWHCSNNEIEQHKSEPSYQKLKMMVSEPEISRVEMEESKQECW